jgi:hypothetical protein
MPIKKSYLEQKWYYRVGKVFFWLLPLIFAGAMFLRLRDAFTGIVAENIVFIIVGFVAYVVVINVIWRVVIYLVFGGLENDIKKPAPAVTPPSPQGANSWAGPIIFLVVIIFLIFLFSNKDFESSGLKLSSHTYGTACTTSAGKTGLYGTNGSCFTCSAGSSAVTSPGGNCSKGIAGVWCCSSSSGTNTNNNGGSSKCVSTGCGNLWRCTGTYYLDGQQIRVDACFPGKLSSVYASWSGTCRQCP